MLRSCNIRLGIRNERKQVIKLALIGKSFGNRKGKGRKPSGQINRGCRKERKKGAKRELQEREWEWAKELEKKKRGWGREQKWEARSKNGVPKGGTKDSK